MSCGWGAAQTLVQAALDILGLSSSSAVRMQTPLSELGLDSMQAVNMRGAIQDALSVSYPLAEVHHSLHAALQPFAGPSRWSVYDFVHSNLARSACVAT